MIFFRRFLAFGFSSPLVATVAPCAGFRFRLRANGAARLLDFFAGRRAHFFRLNRQPVLQFAVAKNFDAGKNFRGSNFAARNDSSFTTVPLLNVSQLGQDSRSHSVCEKRRC